MADDDPDMVGTGPETNPFEIAAARLRGPYNRTQPNSAFGDTALSLARSPDTSPAAYPTADPRFNITQQDVDSGINAALATSGGGMATKGIKAYHSSPHDFDKFDLSKVGSGEGAQAYGHGLYFAEDPKVSGQGGQYWDQFRGRFPAPERQAAEYLRAAGFDRDKAIRVLRNSNRYDEEAIRTGHWPEGHPNAGTKLDPYDIENLKPLVERTNQSLKLLEGGHLVGPRTYEVNINADPAHMLDWDKPLREQQQVLDALSGSRRKAVKETLERQDYLAPTRNTYGTDIGPVTGQDFYKALSYNMTGKPGAAQSSQAMQAGGIPGIKYLDGGSRQYGANIADAERMLAQAQQHHPDLVDTWTQEVAKLKAQTPTSNYVIFDPNKVDIRKKYGLAGASMLPPAAAGLLQPSEAKAGNMATEKEPMAEAKTEAPGATGKPQGAAEGPGGAVSIPGGLAQFLIKFMKSNPDIAREISTRMNAVIHGQQLQGLKAASAPGQPPQPMGAASPMGAAPQPMAGTPAPMRPPGLPNGTQ